MATVSSHTLDSVNGSHAGNIEVELVRIDTRGNRTQIFSSRTDESGRLSEEVHLEAGFTASNYELVFQTGAYFARHAISGLDGRLMREIVVRFRMPEPDARYHIPLMLAPNSYSVWCSA